MKMLIFITLFFSSHWVAIAVDCGGNNVAHTIVVDQNGKGDFKTIQAALDSIQENNKQWVKVHIKAGTYKERVQISLYKPCIFLEGEGREVTIITGNGHSGQDNVSGATFVASPPNVAVLGITFQNSYNLVGSEQIVPAVAAAIYGDKSVFYKCGFVGFQDTLFDALGRHYYKESYIQGEVDFIYGGGQSYFEACTINATQGTSPPGFVTAQYRASENDPSGFVFKGGSVDGSGKVNLGRAYGPYSRVIFHETYLSPIVTPEGWFAWNYAGQESKFTYAEVNCTGKGADTSKRVKWEKKLSPREINQFSLESFINKDHWLSYIPIINFNPPFPL